MKQRKRLIATLLSLALLLSLLPQISIPASAETYSGECGMNLTWSFDNATGVLTISGSGDMYDYDEASLEYPINPTPWRDCKDSIRIISLPNGMTSIGDYAFYDCKYLSSATIPNSMASIGKWAFGECNSLNSITIPDGVRSIGKGALNYCMSLQNVMLGFGLTDIDGDLFYGCKELTEITVAENNPAYMDTDGVLFNKQKSVLLRYPSGKTESTYIIPESVVNIGEYAFSDSTYLTSITIPDNVVNLGVGSFYECTSLLSIKLSANCQGIGSSAFSNTAFYKNESSWENGLLYLDNWLIVAKSSITTASIKENTIGIADSAFRNCSKLTDVIAFEGLTYIGKSAFEFCRFLTNVELPDSVTEIGQNAFRYCQTLSSITLPNNIVTISERMFEDCSSLERITIPDGVISIEDNAFAGCSLLESITIPESVTIVGQEAFFQCFKMKKIYISNLAAWCSIDFKDSVGAIKAQHFLYLNGEKIEDLIIPVGISTIRKGAFYSCVFKNVTIPDSVISIEDYAFSNCSSLSSIIIPDSVTRIGRNAFEYCNSLANITIPCNLSSISDDTFRCCEALTNMTIPRGVESIGANAFYQCTSLESISIPDSVRSVGNWAFGYCQSLKSITIPDGVVSIGSGAFGYCTLVETLTLPNNMSTISDSAFYWCCSISSVTIPDGIDIINEKAFYNCTSLSSVTIPASVKTIDVDAFSWCSNLKDVYYDDFESAWNEIEIRDGNNQLSRATIHYKDEFTDPCTDGHDFGSWTQTKAPTCIENGEEAHVCLRCGKTETRDIEALGHNFVNGICSICGTAESSGGSESHSGKCGDNLTWQFDPETGVLTITGIGDMWDYRPEYAPWCIYQNILTLQLTDGITSIGEYAFSHCSSLTNVTIPDSVTSIGDWAFFDCGSLTSVSIPNSVTSIGSGVFYHCSSLTSVTIPNSVTFISYGVFSDCSALTSITIPNGVTSIGSEVFLGCASLTGVTIPDSVTSIDEYAFNGCDSLTDVYYSGSKAEWDRIDIGDGNDPLLNATIHYNSGGASTEPVSFTDVPAKAFYAGAVSWAVASNITNGTGDGKFSPNDTCTRGQVVTFLWRAFGQPKPTSANNPFTDVKEGKYYYDAVLWAVEQGITSGTEPGKFSPNGECTRGQVVTFLWRAAGKPASVGSDPQIAPQNPFTDVKEGAYYYNAVLWAVGQGVTNGTSDTTFSPNATCTRGQVVTFLFRNLK